MPYVPDRSLQVVPGGLGQWGSFDLCDQVRAGWFWVRLEPTGGGHTLATLVGPEVDHKSDRIGVWPKRAQAKEESLRTLRDRLLESVAEIDRLLGERRDARAVIGAVLGEPVPSPGDPGIQGPVDLEPWVAREVGNLLAFIDHHHTRQLDEDRPNGFRLAASEWEANYAGFKAALPAPPRARVCGRCEDARGLKAATWKCRSCGDMVCEHLCGLKKDREGTCSSCRLKH